MEIRYKTRKGQIIRVDYEPLKEGEHWKAICKMIDLMPKGKGTLYRGTSISPKILKNIKVGQDFSIGQLASFSASEHIGQFYTGNVLLELNDGIHRAIPMEAFTSYGGENEYLMHPKAKFVIESISNERLSRFEYEPDEFGEKSIKVSTGDIDTITRIKLKEIFE